MTKIAKKNNTGLTREKKNILKSMVGKGTTPIDFNKVRDWVKHEKN